MPTYTWRCECGFCTDVVQSITDYSNPKTKRTPWHCTKPMARMITRAEGYNPLAGDRHYDGLVAPDGTLINTRSKHQAYMKQNKLTIADDFKGEWKKAEKERSARMSGKGGSNRAIIEREFTKLEQR